MYWQVLKTVISEMLISDQQNVKPMDGNEIWLSLD